MMRLTFHSLTRLFSTTSPQDAFAMSDLESQGPVKILPAGLAEAEHLVSTRDDANQILRSDASIYKSLYAPAVVGLHLIEQGISAIGTYKLLEASQNAVNGQNPMPAFFEFMVATFCLPPVVQATGQVIQEAWRGAALRQYDNAFVSHDFARPALWTMNKGKSNANDPAQSQNQKNIRSATFESNLRWGVDNEVVAFCNVSKLTISTAVNMSLFAVTMGPSASLALAASTLSASLYARHCANQTSEQSRQSEAASNDMYAHKTLIWDNIVLGNLNNGERWHARYKQLEARDRSTKSAVATEKVARQFKMFGITAAPVGAVLALHGTQLALAGDTTALVRDMVLQMPRLIGTVGQVSSLADAMWSGFLARRRSLQRALTTARATPALDLSAHMQTDNIFVRLGDATKRWSDAGQALSAMAAHGGSGYYTISGVNGAGKSMAMLALQQQLGPQNSMLVPANLGHLDWREVAGSTGQRNLAACQQALSFGPRVLILDEPHANLDTSNRRKLDADIARSVAADNRLVFVISHQVTRTDDVDAASA